MPTIKNTNVQLEAVNKCLIATDLQRNTQWKLEECSVQYGGNILKNEHPTQEVENLKTMTQSRAVKINDRELQLFYEAGGAELSYIYKLLPDGFEVRLLPDNTANIEAISLPGSFAPAGQKKLLLPIKQGMLWDGRGPDTNCFVRDGGHHGFTMQMYGILAQDGGLLCQAQDNVDSRYRYMKDSTGFRVYSIAVSSLGEMRYGRAIRFHFTCPTITAIAKRYRKAVIDAGRFISWEEKLKTRPHLENLFGTLMCFIGYSQDDVDYVQSCQKLRKMGFDRALVYPVAFNTYQTDFKMGGLPPIKLSGGEIEQIKALGYDVAPWSWLNEAIESKNPSSYYKINRENEKIYGWRIDDYVWYKTCSSIIAQQAQKAADGDFKAMTWDHYDVLACVTVGECYDTTHEHHPGKPLSRQDDLQWVREVMRIGRGSGQNPRILSAEGFCDLFSLDYDIGSVKAWPQYGPWSFWPVPLTGLVYHDSILQSWWEVHNYNNDYFNTSHDHYEYGGGRADMQSAMDALYGAPPDVFPFGAQYGWTGKGSETFTFRYRLEDECVQYALKKALPVARLHKKIGKLEMTDFEFLHDKGWIQRTTFADGTKVYANFSNMIMRNLPEVDVLRPCEWKVVDAV